MKEYKRITKRTKLGNPYIDYSEINLDALGVIRHFAELEDKIENGTLVELPCKVGDKVYHIDCYPHIFEDIVDEIWINGYNEVCYDFRKGCRYLVSEFGVKWFTTKAEAEKKLKEQQNER